jgi:hypothetical protein
MDSRRNGERYLLIVANIADLETVSTRSLSPVYKLGLPSRPS